MQPDTVMLLSTADDDLELWAAAMGHWDYGTAADGSMVAY